MGYTSITPIQLVKNQATTQINSTNIFILSTDTGWYISGVDDFAKIQLMFSNPTTTICPIAFVAGGAGTDWVGKTLGNLTTSIAIASTVGAWGYSAMGILDSARFKSSDGALYISTTGSTAGATATVGCAAFLMV